MSEDEKTGQKIIDPREQDKKAKPTYWYDWVLFILIGLFLGTFNVWLNWYMYYCTGNIPCDHLLWSAEVFANDERIGYWGFFIVPFLFTIPAIIFSNMKRARGYGFVIGYMSGGIIGSIIWDLFLGIYTSAVAGILFLIMYFIFWKIWRSFTKFSINENPK